jgi:hypothetical protein
MSPEPAEVILRVPPVVEGNRSPGTSPPVPAGRKGKGARGGSSSVTMGDMSKHSRPEPAVPRHASPVPAAWAVLAGMGITSVIFQVWHAVTVAHLNLFLGVLYGLTPVAVSMGLSHVAALHKAGWVMQALTYLTMAAAMALSAWSIAEVISPAAGPYLRWAFGAVLDGAALIALRVILAQHERAADAAEAEQRAAEEKEMASLRAELAAERARAAAAVAQPRGSAPRKTGTSTRKPKAEAAAEIDPEFADLAEADTWAAALAVRDKYPDISGSKLGPMIGKTPRYGRELLKRMTKPAPDTGPIPKIEATG